jgi:hypothetical protein
VNIRAITFEYFSDASGFDCSVEESFTLHLPISEVITGLGIRWSGLGADFIDDAGSVIAQDPAVHADGPTGCTRWKVCALTWIWSWPQLSGPSHVWGFRAFRRACNRFYQASAL